MINKEIYINISITGDGVKKKELLKKLKEIHEKKENLLRKENKIVYALSAYNGSGGAHPNPNKP